MRPLALLAFAVCVLFGPRAATGQVICVLDSTLTSDAPSCDPEFVCLRVQVGTFTHAYVVANFPGGITGAEFFVANWPFVQSTVATPNPAATIVLGDPIRPTPGSNVPFFNGVNIVFPSCQPAPTWLVLFRFDFFVDRFVQTSCLVRSHSHPSNVNFACPLVVQCNDPVFTATCVSECGTPIFAYPPVGIEPSSWSRLKALYD